MGLASRRLLWGAFTLLGCGSAGSGEAQNDGSTGTASEDTRGGTLVTTASSEGSSGVSTGTTQTRGSSGADDGTTGDAEDSGTTGDRPVSDCDLLDAFVQELEQTGPDEAQAAVDLFIRDAQYADHGLPLRCDDRVVFVASAAGPLCVAGDFNDWEPLPMTRPVEGAPLLIADVAVETPGGLYKMVQGELFLADPLARRYGWDRFGEYSLVDADPARSHHERWPGFAEAVEPLQPRTVRVYVPAAANASQDVAVLVMHDGQNLFSPDASFGGWRASQTAESMIADAEIDPVLIVAIDNTPARFEEYTHVTDDIGGGPIGGQADDYADFVVEGVLPFIQARYPTLTGPGNTAVLGSSLGGLVSLHLAARHPDVFGAAGSMSGTLGWGTFGLDNETMIERYAAAAPAGLLVYLDSGGAGPCPGGNGDNYCENVAFADVLRSQGWVDEDDLFYRWDPGARHNEAAWASRFGIALGVLSGDR